MSVEGYSFNCPNCPFECICGPSDIDQVLSIGLFDIDFVGKPHVTESINDIQVLKSVSFEQDSSSMLSSQEGCSPTSDSESYLESLERGNQEILKDPETEGKTNCEKSQYGLAMVETKEDDTQASDSDVLFETGGPKVNKNPTRFIEHEDDQGNLNLEFLMFSQPSSDDLDTVYPERTKSL